MTNSLGRCNIKATVPRDWFLKSQSGSKVAIKVESVLPDGPFAELDPIEIIPTRDFRPAAAVVVRLPQRTFVPGETVQAVVEVPSATLQPSAFRIVCAASEGAWELASATMDHEAWDASLWRASSRELVITGTSAAPQFSETTARPTSVLALLNFRILPNATEGEVRAGCRVEELLDSLQGPMLAATPQNAVFEDRFASGSALGRVLVAKERPTGYLVYPTRGELVNTAVLTGKRVNSSVVVQRAFDHGRIETVAQGLVCASTAAAALKVNRDCSAAFLDGSERRGGEAVTVSVAITPSRRRCCAALCILQHLVPRDGFDVGD